jgi:hypothetical protein
MVTAESRAFDCQHRLERYQIMLEVTAEAVAFSLHAVISGAHGVERAERDCSFATSL